VPITNCHVHTFTHDNTPDRFLSRWVTWALSIGWIRRLVIRVARRLPGGTWSALKRYAEILETSYDKTQAQVFARVQGFYPQGTRFVVLPMDMTWMNAGTVKVPIAQQHADLATLRDQNPETVIPFAAVDPRHGEGVVASTIALIEQQSFRGLKLYPPTGYHPDNPIIRPLYAYAEQHNLPVLTHCSRPASVQFRGEPTEEMRIDPETGQRLDLTAFDLLTRFTDPDSYIPILRRHPKLRICLAHFGGAGDWNKYLDRPWDPGTPREKVSWLSKIRELIRSRDYPNLWTDIAYTAFADDEFVYLLRVLLEDPLIRARTLYGSDFYVVESARLEERRRAVRIRAVLGEEIFTTIAETNPVEFLGA
jgi:predicted TIM-barrel fold metal-dependent hydrolase